MTPSEHLEKAKALLSDPTKWAKGQYAKDKDGHVVSVFAPQAVSWCADGALWFFFDQGPSFASTYLDRVIPPPFVGVPAYNDALTSHSDLLAWFDRAIALAQEHGK
jgi:hypothetical protein